MKCSTFSGELLIRKYVISQRVLRLVNYADFAKALIFHRDKWRRSRRNYKQIHPCNLCPRDTAIQCDGQDERDTHPFHQGKDLLAATWLQAIIHMSATAPPLERRRLYQTDGM